jgi:hypothetical protein
MGFREGTDKKMCRIGGWYALFSAVISQYNSFRKERSSGPERRGVSVYSQCMISSAGPRAKGSPRGMTAMGIFLLLGAVMASLVGTTLVWRGTALDNMWALNPRAYKELTTFGRPVGIPFLVLGIVLAVASIGWFKYRLWGWRLAVAIIATQILGDLVNAFMGDVVRGSIGFVIAVALLVYLLRSEIRSAFASGNSRSVR